MGVLQPLVDREGRTSFVLSAEVTLRTSLVLSRTGRPERREPLVIQIVHVTVAVKNDRHVPPPGRYFDRAADEISLGPGREPDPTFERTGDRQFEHPVSRGSGAIGFGLDPDDRPADGAIVIPDNPADHSFRAALRDRPQWPGSEEDAGKDKEPRNGTPGQDLHERSVPADGDGTEAPRRMTSNHLFSYRNTPSPVVAA